MIKVKEALKKADFSIDIKTLAEDLSLIRVHDHRNVLDITRSFLNKGGYLGLDAECVRIELMKFSDDPIEPFDINIMSPVDFCELIIESNESYTFADDVERLSATIFGPECQSNHQFLFGGLKLVVSLLDIKE